VSLAHLVSVAPSGAIMMPVSCHLVPRPSQYLEARPPALTIQFKRLSQTRPADSAAEIDVSRYVICRSFFKGKRLRSSVCVRNGFSATLHIGRRITQLSVCLTVTETMYLYLYLPCVVALLPVFRQGLKTFLSTPDLGLLN